MKFIESSARSRALRVLLASGSLVAGCTIAGVDYAPPLSNMDAMFVTGDLSTLVNASEIAWWKDLRDDKLNALVERGLSQNLDIAASLERIEAARTQLRSSGINTQFSGNYTQRATRSNDGTGEIDALTTGADATYVFDLFGGVRRSVEQAQANIDKAEHDEATARLAFLAEIVSNYLQARYFQNAAAISRQTVASQRQTRELVQLRLEDGEATRLEMQQAEQALDRAKADLPVLNASFEARVFRIATLLAEPAGPLLTQMQKGAGLPSPKKIGKAGIPADLIRNRPDLLSAERTLAAATAAIGVAEAQLYPSLLLNGSISETATLSSSGVPDVTAWSFGPAITVPLLNRGVLNARKDNAVSVAKQSEIAWRNAVLNAVEDVQTSLSQTRGTAQQVGFLQRSEQSAKRLLAFSRESYEIGLSPITDVLDAERAVSTARLSLLAARRDNALAWVELQIAVGKGWDTQ